MKTASGDGNTQEASILTPFPDGFNKMWYDIAFHLSSLGSSIHCGSHITRANK